MKYRKKPVIIDAIQWHEVEPYIEGRKRIVDYYRSSDLDGQTPCKKCGNIKHLHGWIDTLEGGHIVCPGDWIITGVKGEHYPVKNDIFLTTYDKFE